MIKRKLYISSGEYSSNLKLYKYIHKLPYTLKSKALVKVYLTIPKHLIVHCHQTAPSTNACNVRSRKVHTVTDSHLYLENCAETHQLSFER